MTDAVITRTINDLMSILESARLDENQLPPPEAIQAKVELQRLAGVHESFKSEINTAIKEFEDRCGFNA